MTTCTVILCCLKHFDSYLNNNNGLRQIHRSSFGKSGSRSELLCNKTKMWTEVLATEQSRTSPRSCTSCQMCETRSPWSGLEVQTDPRNFIWNNFLFKSSPIRVITSLYLNPCRVQRGYSVNSMRCNHHLCLNNMDCRVTSNRQSISDVQTLRSSLQHTPVQPFFADPHWPTATLNNSKRTSITAALCWKKLYILWGASTTCTM